MKVVSQSIQLCNHVFVIRISLDDVVLVAWTTVECNEYTGAMNVICNACGMFYTLQEHSFAIMNTGRIAVSVIDNGAPLVWEPSLFVFSAWFYLALYCCSSIIVDHPYTLHNSMNIAHFIDLSIHLWCVYSAECILCACLSVIIAVTKV